MRKTITLIALILLAFSSAVVAEEMCLVTIKADGVETNYAIANVQKITFDTQSEGGPSFVVNRKSGTTDGGAKLLKFEKTTPTSAQEETQETLVNVNVYSQGKTIFVDAEQECNIMFFNLAGQQLGDCVKASHCECTISLPGSYIVIAGGQQFKIQVK